MEYRVGTVDELRRDRCRIVDVEGRRVGVLSIGDRFYAIHDRCPHMGPSMCSGTVSGTFVAAAPHDLVYGKDDAVIRCPWHGSMFRLTDGVVAHGPATAAQPMMEVSEETLTLVLPEILPEM